MSFSLVIARLSSWEVLLIAPGVMFIYLAFKVTQRFLVNLRNRVSVIRYLFRQNSSLKLKLLNLNSELKSMSAEFDNVVKNWSPARRSPAAVAETTSFKNNHSLAHLNFQEKVKDPLKEPFNETFYSDNAM